ncbi:MAG: class A beta-lactamase [Hyphomicrobiaceae bacterium]|nr:class A beta-lactamase [Hyphomicrobiaceae bacterium]
MTDFQIDRRVLLTICALGATSLAVPAMATESAAGISARLERLVHGLAGRIGVAAQLIGGKEVMTVNGDEPFVMASTVKVAIAATVLDRVDKGELKLDQLIDITPEMIAAGDNVIAQNFVHPGIRLSVANLVEAMITESDNTATDACYGLAGGPAAVTEWLSRVGIMKQRADRATAELMKDFYRLPAPGTPSVVAEVMRKDPTFASRLSDRNLEFENDPRDNSTPMAMLQLLLAIDNGKALSPKSREFLLGSMSRTRTGKARLKGLLPKGVPVAHKTGTLGGVANDVGYVTLPDGQRFAIAVFTSSSTTSEADRDRAIAEIARTLYDYFLTQQRANP